MVQTLLLTCIAKAQNLSATVMAKHSSGTTPPLERKLFTRWGASERLTDCWETWRTLTWERRDWRKNRRMAEECFENKCGQRRKKRCRNWRNAVEKWALKKVNWQRFHVVLEVEVCLETTTDLKESLLKTNEV